MKNKDDMMAKVMSFATKVQGNLYLSSISQGLMQTLPILMIGSIALLLAVLPIDPWLNFITDTGMRNIFLAASTLTTSLIALYSAFCIGYQLAKLRKQEGLAAGLISVFVFLILTPLNEGALDVAWLSAQGLFTAMLAALFASRIYCWVLEKDLTIKMPDGVPPFVSKTFTSLVPAILVGILGMVLSFLFGLTSYGSFAQFIYDVVAMPLQGLTGSVWSLVVSSFITALYLPLDTVNMEAMLAGVAQSDLPNILGKSFYGLFAGIGGAGGTLSLLIVMLIMSKSQKNKALAKLSIVPGFFTINEPVVFGYPLILNPIMAIPFILTPIIQVLVAYGATVIGLVPRLTGVQVPFGMPVIINGFVAGGWKIAVLQVVLIIIGILIYLPFFKVSDTKDYTDEKNAVLKEG